MFVTTVTAFLSQAFLQATVTNMACCAAVAVAVILSFWTVGKDERIIRFPLSGVSILAYAVAYLWVPLVASTATGKPIVHDLRYPFEVFGYLSALEILVSFAWLFYVQSRPMAVTRIGLTRILKKVGVYNGASDSTIWVISLLSLAVWASQARSALELHAGAGGGLTAFAAQIKPLSYLPLVFLFNVIPAPSPRVNARRIIFVLMHFGAIVLVAVATNQRGGFSDPLFSLVIAVCVYFVTGQLRINKQWRLRVISGLALALLLLPFVSKLSQAMLEARKYRTSVAGPELLLITLEQLGKPGLKENVGSGRHNYSENYYGSEFLNRLGNPKVIDNNIVFAHDLGPNDIAEVGRFELDRVYATLPGPILSMFTKSIDKNYNEGRSVGDLMRHMYTGDTPAFIVSYYVADGVMLFGWFFLPLMGILFMLYFPMVDSFVWMQVRKSEGQFGEESSQKIADRLVPVFPIIFFPLSLQFGFFLYPKESMYVWIAGIRPTVELMSLYLILFWVVEGLKNLIANRPIFRQTSLVGG